VEGPLRLYLGCIAPAQDRTIGLRAYGAGAAPPPFIRMALETQGPLTCLTEVSAPSREVIVEIDAGEGSAIGSRKKPDPRKVGLGLSSVMICRPNDLVARLDFLERHAFRLIEPG